MGNTCATCCGKTDVNEISSNLAGNYSSGIHYFIILEDKKLKTSKNTKTATANGSTT
jgi:hypothetical protein